MKNRMLFIAVLALTGSCGSSSDDINVNDLKDVCDCSSAFVTVANEIIDEMDDNTELQMVRDKEVQGSINKKLDIFKNLQNKCLVELDFTRDQMMECDNGFIEVMRRAEGKFGSK